MRKAWVKFKRRNIKRLQLPRLATRLSRLGSILIFLQDVSWIPARLIRGNVGYYLLLNLVLRFRGDYRGAFRILQRALLFNPTNHNLHLRIAEVYRENVEIEQAHTHLELAVQARPGSCTVRKLMFETDHQLYTEGAKTLTQTLDLSLQLLQSHMRTLDRISPYYPDQLEKLSILRSNLISGLRDHPHTSASQLSKAVATAITMRRLDVALELAHHRREELLEDVKARLELLEKNLAAHLPMLDLAWKNEVASDPLALFQGRTLPLSMVDPKTLVIVELFIPPAIFDFPHNEKQTHRTIREFFFHIIHILSANAELVIVPRMQMNWRYCLPKTRDCRVISYHTSGPVNPFHLHIQESPFAGYCSLDHAGFAGFATTATAHAEIIAFVANVPDSILEENQQRLHQAYVANNISKYQQPTVPKQLPISGPYVFVALQVSTDMVAKLGWMSGLEMLAAVVEHYRGSGVRVVVKSHPFCRSIEVADYLDELEKTGEIIRGVGSIHQLIRDAQVVITVNSGVGLESLMHGKLVVVTGACDYSYAAATAKSRGELWGILNSDPVPDQKRIQQMLYYYVQAFAVRADQPELIHRRLARWIY